MGEDKIKNDARKFLPLFSSFFAPFLQFFCIFLTAFLPLFAAEKIHSAFLLSLFEPGTGCLLVSYPWLLFNWEQDGCGGKTRERGLTYHCLLHNRERERGKRRGVVGMGKSENFLHSGSRC